MADAAPVLHSRAELVGLLRNGVGDKVADELIVRLAEKSALSTDQFTAEQALLILERAAREPGLMGIAARFAKSRLLLTWL